MYSSKVKSDTASESEEARELLNDSQQDPDKASDVKDYSFLELTLRNKRMKTRICWLSIVWLLLIVSNGVWAFFLFRSRGESTYYTTPVDSISCIGFLSF